MGSINRWSAAVAAALLAATASLASAQVKEAPTGMLRPTGGAPAAVTEFHAAFNGYHMWTFAAAAEHAQKSMGLAPSFGLARAYLARTVGGPTQAAELRRAAVDAAGASSAEAVLTLALRDQLTGQPGSARTLFDAAVALAPNDAGVAVERALWLSGSARVDALREVSKRFVDDAASRMWLAYFLTMRQGFSRADAAEALELAQAALRIAPNEAGAVTAVAHVLERLGRHDEAMTYLDRATEMTPTSDYAFLLKHEVLLREGKPAEARAALDPYLLICADAGDRIAIQRTQAMTLAYEGRVKEAQQTLAEVANKAESMELKSAAAWVHLYAALVAGGARDGETVQKEIAAARRLGVTGFDVDRNEVIALALAGRPTLARQALANAAKSIPSTGLVRENTLRMLNGLILVAEDKPQEAIPELKAQADNGYYREQKTPFARRRWSRPWWTDLTACRSTGSRGALSRMQAQRVPASRRSCRWAAGLPRRTPGRPPRPPAAPAQGP